MAISDSGNNMDRASKKELLTIISKQEEDINRYKSRFQGKYKYEYYISLD